LVNVNGHWSVMCMWCVRISHLPEKCSTSF